MAFLNEFEKFNCPSVLIFLIHRASLRTDLKCDLSWKPAHKCRVCALLICSHIIPCLLFTWHLSHFTIICFVVCFPAALTWLWALWGKTLPSSSLQPQNRGQCLAQSWLSINVWWINKQNQTGIIFQVTKRDWLTGDVTERPERILKMQCAFLRGAKFCVTGRI